MKKIFLINLIIIFLFSGCSSHLNFSEQYQKKKGGYENLSNIKYNIADERKDNKSLFVELRLFKDFSYGYLHYTFNYGGNFKEIGKWQIDKDTLILLPKVDIKIIDNDFEPKLHKFIIDKKKLIRVHDTIKLVGWEKDPIIIELSNEQKILDSNESFYNWMK